MRFSEAELVQPGNSFRGRPTTKARGKVPPDGAKGVPREGEAEGDEPEGPPLKTKCRFLSATFRTP